MIRMLAVTSLLLLISEGTLIPVGFLMPANFTACCLPPTAYRSAVSAQDRPLPDPETFLRKVRENLTLAERSQHLYTYKERRTDIHTNPFGRLGTGGTSVFHVYPSPTRRLSYRRLMERDGKPVPEQELAEQDREYRLRVDEVLRERALRASDRETIGQESQAARQRQQRAIEDVIDTLQFHVKGRTTHEGVTAIVVTFTPKPNARPTTRQGRTAQKFTGTVWVDEAASEVMRVEAKSTEDITYGGGLVARLGEGTTATVTRRRIGRDAWMPTELTLAGRGRAVLFRTLVVDYAIEWFDYRRLAHESLTPFLDAGVHGEASRRP